MDHRREIDIEIAKSFDLVVVGHEHHPDYKKIGGLGKEEYLFFICGCTYLPEYRNPERYFYRFSIIDYDPDQIEGLHSHFYTRKNLNYCASDTSVCHEASKDEIRGVLNRFSIKPDSMSSRVSLNPVCDIGVTL